VIASFCQAYPAIELEIAASDEMVDLAAGGFDAGIRLGQFNRARYGRGAADAAVPLRGRLAAPITYTGGSGRSASMICAVTPACGMPPLERSITPWSFVDGSKVVEAIVSGPLIAHDYPTLLGAAIQGVGLARVPGPLAKAPIADGRLRALLNTLRPSQRQGLFYITQADVRFLPKLRAFIDHVKSHSRAAIKTSRGREPNATAQGAPHEAQ